MESDWLGGAGPLTPADSGHSKAPFSVGLAGSASSPYGEAKSRGPCARLVPSAAVPGHGVAPELATGSAIAAETAAIVAADQRCVGRAAVGTVGVAALDADDQSGAAQPAVDAVAVPVPAAAAVEFGAVVGLAAD